MTQIIQASMEDKQTVESRDEGRGEIVSESSLPFESLPEGCISNIISFTSPRYACVVALVSKTFESAAKSDTVWIKFLPPEYKSLVPRFWNYSSKKELYFGLCNNPVLIDDGKKSFWIEKVSGKSCIMLSAKSLSIYRGDVPSQWKWIRVPDSRFENVAELINVCLFEIRGRTNTRVLSPRTRYSAYIVFKEVFDCYGFHDVAMKAEVEVVGNEPCRRTICFDEAMTGQYIVKPEKREDGWMEIELGEFFTEGGIMNSDEIEMSVLESKRLNWKCGLIIQGIEIRPAKSSKVTL